MTNRVKVPLLLNHGKDGQDYAALYSSSVDSSQHKILTSKAKETFGQICFIVAGILTCLLLLATAFMLGLFVGQFIKETKIATAKNMSVVTEDTVYVETDTDDDAIFDVDEENDTLLFSNSLTKTPVKKLLKSAGSKTVTIDTPVGKIQGVEMESRLGRKYTAFLKVPYARPPTGKRRFKPPQAIFRWSGTFDGTKYPSECIQKVKYSAIDEAAGDEDCLYMSIYTPQLPSESSKASNLFPVMFYIHGGGFTDGNGTRYGAKYFMDEDVVLITFQYRIGPFGFLNTNDGDILGNMGFKDQVQALKFTKKVIQHFNGDASRITIFGNSAGGMSVGYHLVSPLSAGLFSRAISQSGTAVSAMGGSVDKNPEETAEIFANRFNCSYGNRKKKLSTCLREVDAAELAIVRTSKTKFSLTIEKNPNNAFMPEYPLNLLRQGKINKVPYIAGANSGEGLPESIPLLKSPAIIGALNLNWVGLAPLLFNFNSTAFDPDAMSLRVRDLFFGKEKVSNDTQKNLTALCSDRFMIHATKVQATFHAKSNPVYLYYMTKRPAKSYSDSILKGFPPGDYGAAHADELQYMFLYNGYPEINSTSPWFNISTAIVKLWANFAANGTPGDNWLAFEPKKQEQWYKIDDERSMTNDLLPRMKLWDSYSGRDLTYE